MPAGGRRNSIADLLEDPQSAQAQVLTVDPRGGAGSDLSAESFLKFLRQLIKFRKRKIILVVDNLRVHHAKAATAWLEQHRNRIEVFYLLFHSPELNPDEYPNNGLKKTLWRDGVAITKGQLDVQLLLTMPLLEVRPKLIRSFFRNPEVQCAA